jgi:hypothetical protein
MKTTMLLSSFSCLALFACAQLDHGTSEADIEDNSCVLEKAMLCPEGQVDGCLIGETEVHRCVDKYEACDMTNGCGLHDYCLEPGAAPLCGTCRVAEERCASDEACQAVEDGTICEPLGCACSPAETACVLGCQSDDECGAAEVCSGYRCKPKACQVTDECPSNFECVDQACTRKACEDGAECNGFCVQHACYDDPGRCHPHPF